MLVGRLIVGFVLLQGIPLSFAGADPTPAPAAKSPSKSDSGWGKVSGTPEPRRSASRLANLAPELLKKTAELALPLTVEIVSVGRSVKGLETIRERIVDVRIT